MTDSSVPNTPDDLKGMKILIVEDEIVNLHVLRSALDSLGLSVHIAPGGNTA